MTVHIRPARLDDLATLVEFNRRMAWETEQKSLDEDVLARGVAAVLADPAKGFYLIAERSGEPVGQLMITHEWSDWRNGDVWWIQSVYVPAESRRTGVFQSLYREIERMAKEAGNVVGIRLYVERDNRVAQQTYASLGMHETPYILFEQWTLT